MGESRQELLYWLNDLLKLNITKIEQCGTGAALCQIYDSIFLNIPMSRVKFNVNTEYAYLQNFKILQNCFSRQDIDRIIPVDSLVKCRMQDNLEFLQYSKRYWDTHYPGGSYDAVARRKAQPGSSSAATPHLSGGRASVGGAGGATPNTSAARKPGAARGGTSGPRFGAGGGGGGGSVGGGAGGGALRAENDTLKDAITGLEKERDFYFSKLRDIELLLQTACEADPELEKEEDGLIKNIQAILYSTEDGFEIPAEAEDGIEGEDGAVGGGVEETF